MLSRSEEDKRKKSQEVSGIIAKKESDTSLPSIKKQILRKYKKIETIVDEKDKKIFLAEEIQSGKLLSLTRVEYNAVEQELASNHMKIMRELPHSAVFLKTHFFFQEGEYLYFVQDHIPGMTLRTMMKTSKQMDITEIRKYVQLIVEALQLLHDSAIICCSLNPDNLFILPNVSLRK